MRIYHLFLFFLLFLFSNCSGANNTITTNEILEDKTIPGNHVIRLSPEKDSLVRNPLMGWGIYADAFNPDFLFWDKFDNIKVHYSSTPLKVSNFATHLYIRWPWSAFESSEGVYVWNEPESFLSYLEEGAIKRELKLAFRIYVDSRDFTSPSTPDYVREAGAKGYKGNTNNFSPYPDDPIFQEKFKKFLHAFSLHYNNPEIVDYIDGFGLGLWGEGHGIVLSDAANEKNDSLVNQYEMFNVTANDNTKYIKMFHWITDLYLSLFTKVPLAINYHREIGATLLNEVFEKGYILRHDAFGMWYAYSTFEKSMAKANFPKRPILAESGWWWNGINAGENDDATWREEPYNYKSWRDIWIQTLKDAIEARANTLDLRNILETTSWLDSSKDLVDKFIAEGGYRLFPDEISLPKVIQNGSTIKIHHRWNNLGVGVCPNNIKQWNKKYVVAFALLDTQTYMPKVVLVDKNANPHDWLKNQSVDYFFEPKINNLTKGKYLWGVAILDSSKNLSKGINLAVKNGKSNSGWTILFEATIE